MTRAEFITQLEALRTRLAAVAHDRAPASAAPSGVDSSGSAGMAAIGDAPPNAGASAPPMHWQEEAEERARAARDDSRGDP